MPLSWQQIIFRGELFLLTTDVFNIGHMFDSMCMSIIDILSLRSNDIHIFALGMFNTYDLFNDAF